MNSTTTNTVTKVNTSTTFCREGLFLKLMPGQTALSQVQLFPEGTFTARDGRPNQLEGQAITWVLNSEIANQVIRQWRQRLTPLCIDYEHQTIFSQQNGQPAPAAGWIKDLFYVPNKGLFAKVSWTNKAREYIRSLEYRFISPAFHFDSNTGAILELFGAGLTNAPGLDGLTPVAAKQNLTLNFLGDVMHTPSLSSIRNKLNIPASITNDQLQASWVELTQTPAPESQSPDTLDVFLTRLQFLENQISSLEQRLTSLEHIGTDPVNEALQSGVLLKNQESWARQMQQTNPQLLSKFLSTSQPITALRSMQTQNRAPLSSGLTENERIICQSCNLTEEQFLAAKAKGR